MKSLAAVRSGPIQQIGPTAISSDAGSRPARCSPDRDVPAQRPQVGRLGQVADVDAVRDLTGELARLGRPRAEPDRYVVAGHREVEHQVAGGAELAPFERGHVPGEQPPHHRDRFAQHGQRPRGRSHPEPLEERPSPDRADRAASGHLVEHREVGGLVRRMDDARRDDRGPHADPGGARTDERQDRPDGPLHEVVEHVDLVEPQGFEVLSDRDVVARRQHARKVDTERQ